MSENKSEIYGKIQLSRKLGNKELVNFFINIFSFLAIMIHGWILRIETGIIEEVEADDTLPSDLAKQYNFKF